MFVSDHYLVTGLEPHLVIFDCDGVLVDSEKIYVRVLNQFAARLGLPLSEQEGMLLFKGVHLSKCREIIESRADKPFPDNFEPEYRAAVAKLMDAELAAVKDVAYALREISIPICVASNSPLINVERMLAKTGLDKFFGDRILSGHSINKFKPAPDLFLLAAKTFGADPSNCLVIEDSVIGVQAAQAAKMEVFFYAEDRTPSILPIELTQVKIFNSMRQLPTLISPVKSQAKLPSFFAPLSVLPSPLLNATR